MAGRAGAAARLPGQAGAVDREATAAVRLLPARTGSVAGAGEGHARGGRRAAHAGDAAAAARLPGRANVAARGEAAAAVGLLAAGADRHPRAGERLARAGVDPAAHVGDAAAAAGLAGRAARAGDEVAAPVALLTAGVTQGGAGLSDAGRRGLSGHALGEVPDHVLEDLLLGRHRRSAVRGRRGGERVGRAGALRACPRRRAARDGASAGCAAVGVLGAARVVQEVAVAAVAVRGLPAARPLVSAGSRRVGDVEVAEDGVPALGRRTHRGVERVVEEHRLVVVAGILPVDPVDRGRDDRVHVVTCVRDGHQGRDGRGRGRGRVRVEGLDVVQPLHEHARVRHRRGRRDRLADRTVHRVDARVPVDVPVGREAVRVVGVEPRVAEVRREEVTAVLAVGHEVRELGSVASFAFALPAVVGSTPQQGRMT